MATLPPTVPVEVPITLTIERDEDFIADGLELLDEDLRRSVFDSVTNAPRRDWFMQRDAGIPLFTRAFQDAINDDPRFVRGSASVTLAGIKRDWPRRELPGCGQLRLGTRKITTLEMTWYMEERMPRGGQRKHTNRHDRRRWAKRVLKPVVEIANDAMLEGNRVSAIYVLLEVLTLDEAILWTRPKEHWTDYVHLDIRVATTMYTPLTNVVMNAIV